MTNIRLLPCVVALCASVTALAAPPTAAPTAADADAFIAQVNQDLLRLASEGQQAQWLSVTYITDDSQALAARANEQFLKWLGDTVEQSKRFDGVKGLAPATARAIMLIKLGTSMPAPKDPAKLRELTEIATRMEGTYGAGKSCKDPADPSSCRNLDQLFIKFNTH